MNPHDAFDSNSPSNLTHPASVPIGSLEEGMQEELDSLRQRLMELEEIEVMRVTEESERFDALSLLDDYAKQLEESRDKLARLFRAGTAVQEARTVQGALQKIADAVGEAGWGSVVVQLFDHWEINQSAYFGCSIEDIEFLQTHRRPPEERARFYGPDFETFKVSRSYFVPADRMQEVMSVDNVIPGRRKVRPGDTWDPMDLCYTPLYDSTGNILGSINFDDPLDGRRPSAETYFYLELFADLAARKVETVQLIEQQHRTEEALRQSEIKYRTLFDQAGDGYFLMDEFFRDCNDKACEMWRCTPEDIIGQSPANFSPEFQPDGRPSLEAAREHIIKAMSGEQQLFYWMHRRKDGELLDCEVSLASVVVNNECMVLAIVRDITEKKRAQDELQRMAFLVQNSTDYIAMQTLEGKLIDMNAAARTMVGVKAFDAEHPMDLVQLVHDQSREKLLEAIRHLQTHSQWEGDLDFKNIITGDVVPCQISFFAIRHPETGNVTAVGSVARDLSDQRRSELSLRKSEESLRWLVENLEEPIGVVDPEEKFIFANPAIGRLFCLSHTELIGKNLTEFLDEESVLIVTQQTQLRRSGARGRYQIKIKSFDGRVIPVEITATPQFDREGKLRSVLAAMREIK